MVRTSHPSPAPATAAHAAAAAQNPPPIVATAAAAPPVEGGHADIGGLKIAYAAFKKAQAAHPEEANKKIDGYKSDQRFFLAWAQVWRTNQRDQETSCG
ncbi:MAG: hypothetical protein M3480_01230 [Verrucomicrobiota bacterium]|nr:hypothetical protein [Verrucomicrobiota bacterium]